jgi:hypothetical protein
VLLLWQGPGVASDGLLRVVWASCPSGRWPVMGVLGPVTEVDRSVWQRRAVTVLNQILDAAWRRELPALSWTVGTAGVLVGTCSGDMQARRSAFIAWVGFLGIGDWDAWDSNGTTHMSGNVMRAVTSKPGAPLCKVMIRADVDSLATTAGV